MRRSAFSPMALGVVWAVLASSGCMHARRSGDDTGAGERAKAPSDLDVTLLGLAPAKLETSDAASALGKRIDSYYEGVGMRRVGYLMTDKPLYRPGETIWARVDARRAATLVGEPTTVTVQLLSPRGAVVAQGNAFAERGVGRLDFALPESAEGGEYTLVMNSADGATDRRKVVVSAYEAPRLKKTVELLRKAYGEGDKVSAAIDLARATGEPLAAKSFTAVVTVDDREVKRLAITTDKEGKATARFELPTRIERGEGLLTVLVDDGGVTESIQKRIPIVTKALDVALLPEGGDLVTGLPGRVYFAAKTLLGKPADVEGRVVDDQGKVVTTLKSLRDGMGRFELTPDADRAYTVEITKPAGVTSKFSVPRAKESGCVLRSLESRATEALRVAAICDHAESVTLEAVQRERRVASGSVQVAAKRPAVLELPVDAGRQGAVRITLFDAAESPLAERLVYQGRGQDLRVAIQADKKSYAPRDQVKLHLVTTDSRGKPVSANVGLAVVDDTVLSFADDKSGRVRAHVLLEPELAISDADPIEDPNYYLSDKAEAAAALDALLATRGYRRFEWRDVLAPPASLATATAPEGPPFAAAAAPPPLPMPAPALGAADDRKHAGKAVELRRRALPMPVKAAAEAKAVAPAATVAARPAAPAVFGRLAQRRELADRDLAWGDGDRPVAAALVRVFPVPEYTRPYDGPRTDFRETVYWNPIVETDATGAADVTFPLSDAITSFRAIAEGFSADGVPGGGELVVASKMPLSLDARLPLEVTAGDEIRLPVSMTNETDAPLNAQLKADFGPALERHDAGLLGSVRLNAGEKRSFFFPLDVKGRGAEGGGDVALAVSTLGLRDELKRTVRVVPPGFPIERSASGTLAAGGAASHAIDVDAPIPGSLEAAVTLYPSPVATMTKGMEGMIREPGGCFEQTSATNYPNAMILSYLASNDAADAALVARTHATLERGYKLLTGYETKERGYEWFGQTPGHEALTAYGLMEFADMGRVYDVDQAMVTRTATWLMGRRDGKGGFLRSSGSADTFGRASEPTTNAYIMWALAEAKRTAGLEKERAAALAIGRETSDPYLLALATNTALAAKAAGADVGDVGPMVGRLVSLQAKSGGFPGAKESITMSGGASLEEETTSLATLALMKASPDHSRDPEIRRAVAFLDGHRGGYGAWASTQASILALKALTAYADYSRQTTAAGKATLVVNGRATETIPFEKGHQGAIVFGDLTKHFVSGKNTVELRLDGGASMPYAIAAAWRSTTPPSSPKAKVSVSTAIDKAAVKMGEAVKVRAHVENKTANGVPMTVARVGIPGSLTFQTWQLKELRDKGLVDFYETGAREVVLYWRSLPPNAKKDVTLDLLAQSPGRYEAPASSAYLYYTAEDKAWTSPVKVSVEP